MRGHPRCKVIRKNRNPAPRGGIAALGGALRVSQTQLLQPFLSILAAALLLGESLDLVTLGFAVAVVATVVAGKRFS